MPEAATVCDSSGSDLRSCFVRAASRLRHSSPTPELDARVLTLAAFGLSIERFVARSDEPAEAEGRRRLDVFVTRRAVGEPVSRILGEREFYGRMFEIDGTTLDPRPDTETLVDAALEALRGSSTDAPRILDLGTGSGCILVTLLAEHERATGVGVDLDPQALRIAKRNAMCHGVSARASFVCGNWLDAIGGKFDAIVTNPPYIPSGDIGGLAPEVRAHDPRLALDGGSDGLEAFRGIVDGAVSALSEGGRMIFEIGEGQAESVRAILCSAGFEGRKTIAEYRDLGGIVRCVSARRL